MYWPIFVDPDCGSINKYATPTDGVDVGVGVGVDVETIVGVGVDVTDGVTVWVGVDVGVKPMVTVGVGVILAVGVGVGVTGVGVGVGVTQLAGSDTVRDTPKYIWALVTALYTGVVPVEPVYTLKGPTALFAPDNLTKIFSEQEVVVYCCVIEFKQSDSVLTTIILYVTAIYPNVFLYKYKSMLNWLT